MPPLGCLDPLGHFGLKLALVQGQKVRSGSVKRLQTLGTEQAPEAPNERVNVGAGHLAGVILARDPEVGEVVVALEAIPLTLSGHL